VLALPGPAAWLDAPLPFPDRLLNRYVRGLQAVLGAGARVAPAPLDAGALHERVAAALAAPDHFALGLGLPERVVEALLAAAAAARRFAGGASY
jgi:hypothetical protein